MPVYIVIIVKSLGGIKMICAEDDLRFNQAVGFVSPTISKHLFPLSKRIGKNVQEIRLRINRPIALVCPNVTYYVTENGGLSSTILSNAMLNCEKTDIADSFHNICNYSVYTKQNEIINGFVSMLGGHRAGICGTAVCDNEKIINVRDISSINLRIAREHKNCSKDLIAKLKTFDKGILICGSPCSGKTTVIRDMARILSTSTNKNIALVDERGEIAGTSSGAYQNDIGLCDVYDGYNKAQAIIQAVRSMAPDIIICDELGNKEDIKAVEYSLNCGVTLIATVHCANVNELKERKNIVDMIKTGAFSKLVFLGGRNTPGAVMKICEVGDIFDC